MARLILDTGVIIAGARGRVDMTALADTDDLAIPAIAVAEYLAGTLLDEDPGRAAAQRAYLDEVLRVLPVHDYDRAVADHHAALLAHVRRAGTKRGAHDLIIAATARATGRVLLTTDERARFGELPEVAVRVVTN
ncbi:MAG TPA: PIN domain-containing protein [Mycobacterium sp.]|uniref:PIN domain-containing protein n=1 Tax=Mycobacterium sp. TaxID=1785 RepID=UPI002D5EBCA7|nr:PIN domain-containing protein [Mycobacterium sp.]HZU46241.1 PIN domain-containing protein [Mycobacterium sp.]